MKNSIEILDSSITSIKAAETNTAATVLTKPTKMINSSRNYNSTNSPGVQKGSGGILKSSHQFYIHTNSSKLFASTSSKHNSNYSSALKHNTYGHVSSGCAAARNSLTKSAEFLKYQGSPSPIRASSFMQQSLISTNNSGKDSSTNTTVSNSTLLTPQPKKSKAVSNS